jgi:long-chain acyl-CoA synthetase
MRYPEQLTLQALVRHAAARFPKRTAFSALGGDVPYHQVSYGEFGARALSFAGRLMGMGVGPGDRVMILAENRPEWPIAYFGIALAGAVSVPVLVDFSAEQVQAIAGHAAVKAVCVTGRTAAKVGGTAAPVLADGAAWAPPPLIHLDTLLVTPPGTVPGTVPPVEEEDLASIIYTSGTTGHSKGVMLSHRNLVYTALATRSIFKIYPRDRFLSIVPLAHTFECTIGMLIAVLSGASTAYLDRPPAPAVLLPAVRTIRPTVMLTVPLIIEKIYRNSIEPSLKANPLYRFPLTRPLAVNLAGQRLLSLFGGAIRFFSIGGAALAEDVEVFLRKVQFPYALGYGMTEASPLLAGTAPFKTPLHSAGRTLKGVELRIVDGEIQARGPNIMMGYYQDEERTRASFTDDGWFKTGDLGAFDKKGRLFIKGRLKALILGPSGENIYPEEIEGLLAASEIVEDALVYPGEKGELVALIVLSEKAQTMLAAIGDRLGELKDAVNKRVAAFSRISRIEVRTEPFEKTATQKIRRFLYHGKKE